MVQRMMIRRAMMAMAIMALAILAAPGGAFAQQQGIPVSELLSRLDRLERDVSGLRRAQGSFGSDGLARLDQIESELRRLTGTVERLEYDASRAAERAEKQALDFETRLQALERGAPAASVANAPAVVGVLPPPPQTQVQLQPQPLPSDVPLQTAPAPQQVLTQLPRPVTRIGSPAFSTGTGAIGNVDTAPDLSAIPGAPAPAQQILVAPQPSVLPPAPSASVTPSFSLDPPAPAVTLPPATTTAGLAPPQPAGGASSPGALYDEGLRLLNLGLFEEAGAVFEQVALQYPDDPATGQAKFWLGDMHLRLGRFDIAAKSFLESFKGWPNGPKAPDSLLKLGITLASLGQREEACLTFTQFGPRYPQAGEALLRRAELEARRAQCGG